MGSIQGKLEPKTAGPDAVVMARPKDGTSSSASGGKVRVHQSTKGFAPNVSVIGPGGTVVFENVDKVYHNAFNVQPDAKFDVGSYAPGETRSVKFKKAGVYRVFCELHPKESAYVVVSADRWHTRPGPDGKFEFDDIPFGTYQVRVWRPEMPELSGTVEVKSGEPAVVRLGNSR